MKFAPSTFQARFPLLIKLLDCADDLSVQVHPTDDYHHLPAGELGKTEMWYVIDAKPGAKIICGLKKGCDREQLIKAIEEYKIMECLHEVPVKTGDTFFIPAGTVHALCAGVLVAEIQQNSDTTYRLHDYDRPGLDGQPRELHIEDSLNVIRFDQDEVIQPRPLTDRTNQWYELVACDYFITEKAVFENRWVQTTSADTFSILVFIDGQGELLWTEGSINIKAGYCVFLPANLGEYTVKGIGTVLRTRLP